MIRPPSVPAWRGVVTFLVPFAALCAGGLWLLQQPAAQTVVWRMQVAIAATVGRTMALLGYRTRVSGSEIVAEGAQVTIIDECTGVYAMILLGSFLLAFPAPWWRRLATIGIALVFVTVVNHLRLVALAVLLVEAPEVGKFAHDYIWQVVWGSALVAFALLATARRPRPAAPVG